MKGSDTQAVQRCAARAFENTINVDETERLVSAIGGGAILLTSARLRSLRGLVATLMGASLIDRGVTGHCPRYSLLGVKTSDGRAANAPRGFLSASGSRERVGVGVKSIFDSARSWAFEVVRFSCAGVAKHNSGVQRGLEPTVPCRQKNA